MTIELLTGNPDKIVADLIALGATTIQQLILSHEKGKYIVVWS